MTVWASFDGGKSWPVKPLVNEGMSAYSSLAAGKDGTIYLLVDRGEKKLYDPDGPGPVQLGLAEAAPSGQQK